MRTTAQKISYEPIDSVELLHSLSMLFGREIQKEIDKISVTIIINDDSTHKFNYSF
jgi:hypothetical protein